MAITDLTGTTWYLDSTKWNAINGYGSFDVNMIATFPSGRVYNYNKITIGYSSDGNVYFGRADGYAGTVHNASTNVSFTLEFTGGADVADPSLISWLETNGTMLKVTDLTDTTWAIPSGWTATAGYGTFDVNGTLIETSWDTDVLDFSAFWIGYFLSDSMPAQNNLNFRGSSTLTSNNYSFTLAFTGGTDITKPALIAWLSKYGELQEETKPTKVFTRLYIGNTVASSGGKCFKRLTTEE